MSFSFRNLWNNIFLPDEPPPPQRAEPSCFAKGIAKSIAEEPEAWEEGKWPSIVYSYARLTKCLWVTHRAHGVSIGAWITHCAPYLKCGCNHIGGIELVSYPTGWNSADSTLIAQTIEAHPLGQYKKWVEDQETHERRKATAQDYFNELGCPTPASPLKPITETRPSRDLPPLPPPAPLLSPKPKRRVAKRKAR